MEKLHYSLFQCQSVNGETLILNLGSLTTIATSGGLYQVSTPVDIYALDTHNGNALIGAWNRYLTATHAEKLIRLEGEPVTAIKAGLRQDDFLGQLVELTSEKPTIRELSLKAQLRDEEVYL